MVTFLQKDSGACTSLETELIYMVENYNTLITINCATYFYYFGILIQNL